MALCTCVTGPASGYSHEILYLPELEGIVPIYVFGAMKLRSDDGGFEVAMCVLNTRYVLERLQW